MYQRIDSYLGDKQYFDVLREGPAPLELVTKLYWLSFGLQDNCRIMFRIKSLTAGIGFSSILSVIYFYKFSFNPCMFHAKLCKSINLNDISEFPH